MAERLMFFLRRTDDVAIVNRVVHILYTFNYYFTSVIESHLEFAHSLIKINHKQCGEYAKYFPIIEQKNIK